MSVSEVRKDLRELADNPVTYGQETHGELHAEALAALAEAEALLRRWLEYTGLRRRAFDALLHDPSEFVDGRALVEATDAWIEP